MYVFFVSSLLLFYCSSTFIVGGFALSDLLDFVLPAGQTVVTGVVWCGVVWCGVVWSLLPPGNVP